MAPEATPSPRRANNIKMSGSPLSSSPQRKQRAVLTCEECRRKKIRCTRGRNGICERCKAQGIPCRPSTSESLSAPKIVMPEDLDYSVVRLYHVVQDLQRRLGMTDVDLSELIRRHCAPELPGSNFAGPSQQRNSPHGSYHSPRGSSHDTGSSVDGQYSPVTPPDDDDVMAGAAGVAGADEPLFVGSSSGSSAGMSSYAQPPNGMVMVKSEHGGPPVPAFAVPRMPSQYAERAGAGMPTPPAEYLTRESDFMGGPSSNGAGPSASWMLDPQTGAAVPTPAAGSSSQNGYLVDLVRDGWAA